MYRELERYFALVLTNEADQSMINEFFSHVLLFRNTGGRNMGMLSETGGFVWGVFRMRASKACLVILRLVEACSLSRI